MNNYTDNFCKKIRDYRKRYGSDYGRISWHMLFFLLRNWFGGKHNFKRSGDTVNIGFLISGGGIGDIVITGAYIDRFVKKLDCKYKIHLFVPQNINDIQLLFNEYKENLIVHNEKDLKNTPLDLLIKFFVQFPEIVFYREKFIKNKSNFLPECVNKISGFNNVYSNIVNGGNVFEHQVLLDILGHNRVSGMDAAGVVGLVKSDTVNIHVPEKAKEILKLYGLVPGKFITFAYSLDMLSQSKESIKLWPKQHFQKLINMIKKEYPGYKIVQLGGKKLAGFENVDVDLVEKTSFSELLALLSESKIHIDSECGMVHLRHAINKKTSVVIHGPTSVSTKGYDENINIRSNVCNCPGCEWLVGSKWQNYCIKNDSSVALCMLAITPEMVFEKLKGLL